MSFLQLLRCKQRYAELIVVLAPHINAFDLRDHGIQRQQHLRALDQMAAVRVAVAVAPVPMDMEVCLLYTSAAADD